MKKILFVTLSFILTADCLYNYVARLDQIEAAPSCGDAIQNVFECPFGGSADIGLVKGVFAKCKLPMTKKLIQHIKRCERLCQDEKDGTSVCVSNKALCRLNGLKLQLKSRYN